MIGHYIDKVLQTHVNNLFFLRVVFELLLHSLLIFLQSLEQLLPLTLVQVQIVDTKVLLQ
jgi:hypothetical protein